MVGVVRVVAVLLILAGLVWTGQGLGYIKGSFMTGSAFWAVTGLICLLAGAFLVWWSTVRATRPRT